ncbi:hypothetical protein FA15DRAFT_670751 [Coprinopsis marcescibilis]|uniref:DNA2/NAM7 helicase helicase domain-containing protein n=1 Tax=Coprinopsis marcescibilis TaxID=230819 RepID=A0A5C3KSG2_COPMA|nr:hypothetical protein FA15DRAFT_670751 [Coprinopsis marcescibilis]
MDRQAGSLSATNLAVYHHLRCDLYLHNIHNKPTEHSSRPSLSFKDTSESCLKQAHFHRGLNWETTLFSWLDDSNLLLKVPSLPLEATVLKENILADDREHYFIAGLVFKPPHEQLAIRFAQHGMDPVAFGLGKPDLLEIRRKPWGVTWKIIDAKASKSIKTSHHVQIYFYSLCLQSLLPSPFFEADGGAGVWLAPEDGFSSAPPSFEDIKTIQLSLLRPSLDAFLFDRLPRLLSLPKGDVRWHFNPLCSGCNFKEECKSVTIKEGRLGSMPNISISDARTLHELLDIGHQIFPDLPAPGSTTDIEDLHLLLSKEGRITRLEQHSPITMKKVKGMLSLPKRRNRNSRPKKSGPVLDATRNNSIRVIPRKNFTLPSVEDVAILLSLVQDPALPNPTLEYFFITAVLDRDSGVSFSCGGPSDIFVPALAETLRKVTHDLPRLPATQFYVWSTGEQSLLQSHLINTALASDVDRADIRLCIGALAQGASLLQTSFQPVLLAGALLSFLGKSRRSKFEYIACLDRMGLDTSGSVPEMRTRIEVELQRLQGAERDKPKEAGLLAPVAVLKKEVERLLAFPIPGYWDLRECYEALVGQPDVTEIPDDNDILSAFRLKDNTESLKKLLLVRNQSMYDVLKETRRHIEESGLNLLVNEGKPMTSEFMDICRHDHLSKLFFMQQFEVYSKLTELWSARIDGSPEAPLLDYIRSEAGPKGTEHIFRLVSGFVDVPGSDKDHAFFDKLLVEDVLSDTEAPVESLFDDLSISGLVIPLNRWTKSAWDAQHPRVQEHIRLADIHNVFASAGGQTVVVRTWGATHQQLIPGQRYRLSPRLVDFNTTKILSSLFEMDWLWCESEDEACENPDKDHRMVPFLQLIMDPQSFGKTSEADDSMKKDSALHRMFKELGSLNDKAKPLQLKPSQQRAMHRILSNRLTVIWGPPGTGKTHTVALSLLRLLDVQWRQEYRDTKIIFITAMTHAAIDACLAKLEHLIDVYRSIDSLELQWLDQVKIQRVLKGTEHSGPQRSGRITHIYAGTLFQLYNFSRSHSFEVDCVVADEAGQIPLAALPLVLRSLSRDGRIIVAGDSEQLAPIFSGSYPRLKMMSLFGSVLDCLMFTASGTALEVSSDSQPPDDSSQTPTPPNTIIQLTENFRQGIFLTLANGYSHFFGLG